MWQEKLRNVSQDMLMCDPVTPLAELKANLENSMRHRMELLCLYYHALICKAVERIENGRKFLVEKYDKEDGGAEIACMLQNGNVIEKAGIHFASMNGNLPSMAIQQMKRNFVDLCPEGLKFFVASVSCVIHAVNPHVPTTHFNYRYFEVKDTTGKTKSWFGGGHDLTPTYLIEEDVIHFHKVLREACDKHNPGYYPKFKKCCDDYFWNTFRDERRGVGGIFFDHLDEPDLESCFEFVFSCCEAIIPAYIPIVQKHLKDEYTEKEKQWQQFRRGRYVEFNLILDRGTKFGLFTPGIRVESILMSMPLTAMWLYNHQAAKGSKEDQLMQVLRIPRDWA